MDNASKLQIFRLGQETFGRIVENAPQVKSWHIHPYINLHLD